MPRQGTNVGDIAPTGDADLVVNGKSLVMHTPVGLLEIADEIQLGKAASRNWIEQPDFDIRMLVDQQ